MPESKYSRKGAQGCTCTPPHKGLVWLWFCFSLNPKALGNPWLKKKTKKKQTKQTDRFLETSRFSRVPVASEIPSKFYSLHTSIYKIEIPHKKYVLDLSNI